MSVWGSVWGHVWGNVWGSIGAPTPPAPFTVTVLATRDGFFGGHKIEIGGMFEIDNPLEFSPYWMVFVDTPPGDWLPFLRPYSLLNDIERVVWRGEDETRLNAPGSPEPK